MSNTPSSFRLHHLGSINSSISFRVFLIFLVGHFIITPPLYENLEKYPPLLLVRPRAMKHKIVDLNAKKYWTELE